MTGSAGARDLLAARLRRRPGLELVPRERLEASASLPAPRSGELFGIARWSDAPAGGSHLEAIDTDLALVLYALDEPGRLPAFVRRALGDAAARQRLGEWVLDGLLEVHRPELGAAGSWDTGASALEAFGLGAPPTADDELARRSLRLLELTVAGDVAEGGRAARHELAERLYRAGREPDGGGLEGCWKRGVDEVCAALGATPSRIDFWTVVRPSTRSRGVSAAGAAAGARPVPKLYVSPAAADLGEALRRLAPALRRIDFVELKVGATLDAVLRPDKLVLYFEDRRRLEQAAESLLSALRRGEPSLRVHGVPFSGALSPDGLLSWAIDPVIEGEPMTSWRAWLAQEIAAAIVASRRSGSSVEERCGEVLQRLHGRGVDVAVWAPLEAR
ncbi:MAG: hypothetical protein DWQ36_21800 [Acidobacteria bacterium]|nr:MAG: hypothetical protein DWQ36_21800 [Acidobacteriota bacterium]